jgi:arylsulfatase A-like enzyme
MGCPAAVFFLALMAACARESRPTGPRLVVLYATCSLNKDFLTPYDPKVPFTPALAALAQESVVFERHVTESAVSGIAYASLFTGAQADEHGIFHHPSRLTERMLTVFEAFAAAGYETYYWNGHPMASAELGYAQGVPPEHVYPSADYTGNDKSFARTLLRSEDPWFRALLDGLKADPERHALVVANFTVTHAPYTRQTKPAQLRAFLNACPAATGGVPVETLMSDLERFGSLYDENRLPLQWDYPATVARLGLSPADQQALERVLRAQYCGNVTLLDAIVGGCLEVLRASGLDADTLFAFTADHGEYLFHAERLFQWGHGLQLAPEELSVPWILRPPKGLFSPGRYHEVTRSIDVFPTLAGLCGVPLPAGAPVQGHDLSTALRGTAAPPPLIAPSHTKVLDERLMREFADLALVRQYYPSTDPDLMWVSVRDGEQYARWRNRGDGVFVQEHFLLTRDPFAFESDFDPTDPEHARLARFLEEYKARLVASYGTERGVDAETIEEDLKALGYVR